MTWRKLVIWQNQETANEHFSTKTKDEVLKDFDFVFIESIWSPVPAKYSEIVHTQKFPPQFFYQQSSSYSWEKGYTMIETLSRTHPWKPTCKGKMSKNLDTHD